MLHPICGDRKTRPDSVTHIIEQIIDDDATGDCEALEYSNDYAGRLYNGTRTISPDNAAYINTHINKPRFETYLSGFSDDVAANIVVALEAKGIAATAFNYAGVSADLFAQIFLDIASETGQPVEATSMDAVIFEKYGLRLFVEAGAFCPNDDCDEPLYFEKHGKSEYSFIPTSINPEDSPLDFDNLIALCPKCSDYYSQSPSDDEIRRMSEIKASIKSEAASQEIASDVRIESGIRLVLQRIATAEDAALIDLSYTPQMVINKITGDNKALRRKVLSNVVTYFGFVGSVFRELNDEGQLRFDKVAVQIKNCDISENEDGRSQPEIFAALVNWLQRMTNEDTVSCEVVISYFVQSCEVFDAPAE
jgi:hypothetical protein